MGKMMIQLIIPVQAAASMRVVRLFGARSGAVANGTAEVAVALSAEAAAGDVAVGISDTEL